MINAQLHQLDEKASLLEAQTEEIRVLREYIRLLDGGRLPLDANRVETAKRNGIESFAYLRHVFTEIPKATTLTKNEALLPRNVDPVCLRDVSQ